MLNNCEEGRKEGRKEGKKEGRIMVEVYSVTAKGRRSKK